MKCSEMKNPLGDHLAKRRSGQVKSVGILRCAQNDIMELQDSLCQYLKQLLLELFREPPSFYPFLALDIWCCCQSFFR